MPYGPPNPAPAETAATIGALVNGASTATLADSDLVPVVQSSVTKKSTFTAIKAFLKTYFDTLYAAAGSGITNSAGAGDVPVTADGAGNLEASGITKSGSDLTITTGGALTLVIGGDATLNGGNLATSAAIEAAVAGLMANPIVTPSRPTTGQVVSATSGNTDETLYITPAGTLLALTVRLPSSGIRVGQIVRGFISQIITGLTVDVAGGGTVVGATPATAAVNSTFAYQCVDTSGFSTWIRIQ